MKLATMTAAVLVLLAASAARAQDVTVRITATIPAAARAEMVAMIAADPAAFPPIYTSQVQVVDGITNTVQVVVPETPRAKFVRLSAAVIESYWRRQVVRYRRETQPVPVTTAPVTAGETP
jgi:hypothetical protein